MNRSLLVLLALSCADLEDMAPSAAPPPVTTDKSEDRASGGEGGRFREEMKPASEAAAAPMGGSEADVPADGVGLSLGKAKADADERDGKKGEDAHEAAATRSWFPESFFWMPAVETDASGTTTVPVAIPDSLTTWRVLGLGWTRDGAQGGAELSVLSTLPAFVDVVVPGSLYAGDVVDLPVQVVNTTGAPLSAALDVRVSGASGSGAGSLSVPGGGSATRTVRIRAERAGTAVVAASFGSVDAVERSIPIRPAGLPQDSQGSGAVGGAPAAIPAGSPSVDNTLEVTVWSGASSVVSAEIGGADLGGGASPFGDTERMAAPLADSAYRFALSLAGATLAEEDVSADSLRALRIRAWQPLARAGRVPDVGTACLLAEATRGAATGTIEGDLHERMVEFVRGNQAPDGTWVTGAGTVDGTLAQTAACARAAGDDDAVKLRAEGAFARNVQRLEDPYLAAWALASGAISDPELTSRLTEVLGKALVTDHNGAHLHVAGLRRADGSAVNDAEATAVAALALASQPELASTLATGLLALRNSWGGWGDGASSLLALRALDAVFTMDKPVSVGLELVVGGSVVATGKLGTDLGYAPTRLVTPWSGEAAKLEVRAAAPSPGLVYTWRARSWAPWGPAEAGAAEVAVVPPNALHVGKVAVVGVRAATPSAVAPTLRVGLPAGVRADPLGMDRLVASAGFVSWHGGEGFVEVRGLPAGGWEGELPVVAALAGSLSSGATTLLDGTSRVAFAPPTRWTVSP